MDVLETTVNRVIVAQKKPTQKEKICLAPMSFGEPAGFTQ
jgi:hypothetical protein